MPYFLYKFYPNRRLEPIETFDKYQDAKKTAHSLRAELPADADYIVKMIFAQTPDDAKRMLLEVREAPPSGVNEEF